MSTGSAYAVAAARHAARRPPLAPASCGALALSVLLAACGRAPQRISVAFPASTVYDEQSVTPGNVFESLTFLDERLQLRPGLARSWHNPDETTWVFELHQGVRLHDGRTLTAQDVVASLEWERREGPERGVTGLLEGVLGATASDASHVVLRTHGPVGPLAHNLARVPIRVPPDQPFDRAAGSGPFRLARRERGRIVLEAFAGYRGDAPHVGEVEFQFEAEARERLRRLRDGRVQLVVDVPHADFAALERDPQVRAIAHPGIRLLVLGLDCARAESPYFEPPRNAFRDVRVRRAVAAAIDRQALVREALGGHAQSALRVSDADNLGLHPLAPMAPPDVAGAKRWLAEAGFAAGFQVSLHYSRGRLRDADAIVGALARDLARVGIRVEPSVVEDLLPRLGRNDTAFFLSRVLLDRPDTNLYFASLVHTRGERRGGFNASGYSNPEVDAWIEEALHALLPERRAELLQQVSRQIELDVPLVPLVVLTDLYAADARVEFTPRLDRAIDASSLRFEAR